jgi:uncharacterized membrane protein (UPF0127 family)
MKLIKVKIQTDSSTSSQPFFLYSTETSEELIKGLMFVEHLPQNVGMLFNFDRMDYHSIWMKNTILSLDILFLNNELQIIDIVKCATPLSTKSIGSKMKSKYIIELNCGTVDTYNIKIGNKIVNTN